jgi:putative nucleotidyltransferase with HDIG domain
MDALGTTAPDSDLVLQRLIAESRDRLPKRMRARERLVDMIAAAGFLVAAVTLAAVFEPSRPLDEGLAIALVACYALASRVEFAMGSGWAVPTQLFFVPMLFLLPTAAVPLFVAAALVIARLPEYVRGAVHAQRVVIRIAEAWYSIWPALVLSIAGVTTAVLGDWPWLVAALVAQFAFDLALTAVRLRATLGLRARPLLDEMRAVYVVDALLTPVGFLGAVAAERTSPYAVLGLLPMLGLLEVFARERAARIDNAVTLAAAYRGTAHLLGELLSNSHEYTGSHSQSVVVLAHQVGEALGLDDDELREIEFGALLHDVGKMAVPIEVINKPAELTEQERELVRRHPVEGAQMLARIGGVLGEAGEVVRRHHENYDGSGYPDGLAGDDIPLAARVIACCDAYNAMTTDRPYRASIGADRAIAELRAGSGTQFDPRVVEAVIEIVSSWDG